MHADRCERCQDGEDSVPPTRGSLNARTIGEQALPNLPFPHPRNRTQPDPAANYAWPINSYIRPSLGPRPRHPSRTLPIASSTLSPRTQHSSLSSPDQHTSRRQRAHRLQSRGRGPSFKPLGPSPKAIPSEQSGSNEPRHSSIIQLFFQPRPRPHPSPIPHAFNNNIRRPSRHGRWSAPTVSCEAQGVLPRPSKGRPLTDIYLATIVSHRRRLI